MRELGGGEASRHDDSSTPAPAPSGTRVRSRVACQTCNRRKVRCDVAQTSHPCSNCQRDGGPCIVLPRKKHRPRRRRIDLSPSGRDRNSSGGAAAASDNGQGVPPPSGQTGAALGSTHVNDFSSSEDEEDHFISQEPEDDTILPDDSSFTYLGDKRGPRSAVYDICDAIPPQDSRPLLPPKEVIHTLYKPNQVEYMRSEGVFATLSTNVCDAMIRSYFKHVHFFLPVVDAEDFLNEYHRQGSHKMHDLLFWSMMLAAANFADADLLRRAGFASRKAMKTAMYGRAKCLYDLDRATGKLKLIQSVLLLSFWYTDPQDHTGAWYWIGIAISLAQGIGLHRYPRSNNRSQQLSPREQALRRRIWWACVVRDRWVSLAKGRPMRIHNEDCDTPIPSSQDVLGELDSIVNEARTRFLAADPAALTSLWLRFVRISDVLGGILRLHYRVSGPDATITEIDTFAQRLQSLSTANSGILDDWDETLSIHAYQIDLFYQATVAILYRPYALNSSTSLPSGSPPDWQKVALRRARDAATSTNALMQSLIELDAIKYLKPMIITAIIPAMQIHLSDCKSSKALIQGLARHKLQLCMLVLSSLRVTYWSADVMYRLFDRAQNILSKSKTLESSSSDLTAPQPNAASYPRQAIRMSDSEGQVPVSVDHEHRSASIPTLDLPTMANDSQQLWFTVSPQFSNVDQLLSPGFSLSEDVFQNFFPNYDGKVYGQHTSSMGDKPTDEMLYSNMGFS